MVGKLKLFALLMLVVLASGCASKDTVQKKEDMLYKSDITITVSEDLSMYVKEGTISSKGMTVVVDNQTGSTLYGGEDNDYHLEYFSNGEWYYVIPKDDGWCVTSVALIYGIGHRGIKVDWERYYGELSPGKYRFVKDFFMEHRKKGEVEKEDIWLAAEFNIE